MKLSMLGLLMLMTSAVSAQGSLGCQPAAIAALELKSIADDHGQDAALDEWHSMRAMQELPVWHEMPLRNLMEMPLQDMTTTEVRGTVLVACTLTFSEFARETARQLEEDLKKSASDRQSLVRTRTLHRGKHVNKRSNRAGL